MVGGRRIDGANDGIPNAVFTGEYEVILNIGNGGYVQNRITLAYVKKGCICKLVKTAGSDVGSFMWIGRIAY